MLYFVYCKEIVIINFFVVKFVILISFVKVVLILNEVFLVILEVEDCKEIYIFLDFLLD